MHFMRPDSLRAELMKALQVRVITCLVRMPVTCEIRQATKFVPTLLRKAVIKLFRD